MLTCSCCCDHGVTASWQINRLLLPFGHILWTSFLLKYVTWKGSVPCDSNPNLKHRVHNGLGHLLLTCSRRDHGVTASWQINRLLPFGHILWTREPKQSGGMSIVSQSICFPVTDPFTTACPSVFESFLYKHMSREICKSGRGEFALFLSPEQDNCFRTRVLAVFVEWQLIRSCALQKKKNPAGKGFGQHSAHYSTLYSCLGQVD